jgi:hypothetical protein
MREEHDLGQGEQAADVGEVPQVVIAVHVTVQEKRRMAGLPDVQAAALIGDTGPRCHGRIARDGKTPW